MQYAGLVDLSKLPEDACACIGAHVQNTSEIGTFKVISHSFENGVLRLMWKVKRMD